MGNGCEGGYFYSSDGKGMREWNLWEGGNHPAGTCHKKKGKGFVCCSFVTRHFDLFFFFLRFYNFLVCVKLYVFFGLKNDVEFFLVSVVVGVSTGCSFILMLGVVAGSVKLFLYFRRRRLLRIQEIPMTEVKAAVTLCRFETVQDP